MAAVQAVVGLNQACADAFRRPPAGAQIGLTGAVMEAASLRPAAAYLHLLRDFTALGKLLLFRRNV